MPSCKCAGASCGCSVIPGNGVSVEGTGSQASPFVISIDPSTFNLGASIRPASSSSLELTQVGTGATNDPVVMIGDVVLKSPNGSRWAPSISNTGTVTWAAAPAARTGVGTSGGTATTVVENDVLYWNGSVWDSRSSLQAHAIWVSLGFTGVPVPTGFKAGDTWLCEAS